MTATRKLWPLLLAAAAGCAGVSGRGPATDSPPPVVQREMRGLWVATVANIDWPSRKGLTAREQQAELIGILDKAAKTGFNTIVFQVRPAADALYASPLEPWAAWLSGNQGEHPGYDPLAFAIAESHARGMQLHAWINPFRAGNTADTAKLAPGHVFNTRRDLVRVYGGNLWMDPGDPAAQERSIDVIRDIVTRYDIDGMHADDYFYPYQVRDSAANGFLQFPDDSTWARHGGGMSRDDWRRANIDRFVERMYREVHAIKPGVVVGISPFGIWRPGYPASVSGLDAYASIYADSRKWLQRGWVDYFVPQLYWAIGAPQQSFPVLLDWWIGENAARRHVWPGLATYRVANGTPTAFSLEEIPTQIRLTRDRLREPGEIHFNTKAALERLDATVRATLERDLYGTRAIVPAYPWLDSIAPAVPRISVSDGTLRIAMDANDPARWWLVRAHLPARRSWRGRKPAAWSTRLEFAGSSSIVIDPSTDRLVVQAIDQAGNASAPVEWRKP
ncbi:MAG TPA: family 10 glycosylhydrolase [Gemmatimonadaceae bacterium]|nr:family 10 glycosylhydrolase [Gemmatimonadaceae bacterium]